MFLSSCCTVTSVSFSFLTLWKENVLCYTGCRHSLAAQRSSPLKVTVTGHKTDTQCTVYTSKLVHWVQVKITAHSPQWESTHLAATVFALLLVSKPDSRCVWKSCCHSHVRHNRSHYSWAAGWPTSDWELGERPHSSSALRPLTYISQRRLLTVTWMQSGFVCCKNINLTKEISCSGYFI